MNGKGREELLQILKDELSENQGFEARAAELCGYDYALRELKCKLKDQKENKNVALIDKLIRISGIREFHEFLGITVEDQVKYQGYIKLLEEHNAQRKIDDEVIKKAILNLKKQNIMNRNLLLEKNLTLAKVIDIMALFAPPNKAKKYDKAKFDPKNTLNANSEEITCFLQRWGYKTENQGQYIIATNKEADHSIFIKLAQSIDYQKYDKAKTIVLIANLINI